MPVPQPTRTAKPIRAIAWLLNMNGIVWSPAACDIAHSLIRSHGRVRVTNLPGQAKKRIEFGKHPELQVWSDAQLKQTA